MNSLPIELLHWILAEGHELGGNYYKIVMLLGAVVLCSWSTCRLPVVTKRSTTNIIFAGNRIRGIPKRTLRCSFLYLRSIAAQLENILFIEFHLYFSFDTGLWLHGVRCHSLRTVDLFLQWQKDQTSAIQPVYDLRSMCCFHNSRLVGQNGA